MGRRRILVGAGLALGLAITARWGVPGWVEAQHCPVVAGHSVAVAPVAARIHADAFVADLHADSIFWDRDLVERGRRGQADLPRFSDGRVALQVFSTVTHVPPDPGTWRIAPSMDRMTPLIVASGWPPRTWRSRLERALFQAERLHATAARSKGGLVLIRLAEELDRLIERRARGDAVIGGLLAVEGLQAIEGRIENVDRLFEAGFRMMGLTHLADNELAGSRSGAARGGLSPLGRAAIERMERLGIVVDLAHASDAALSEALELARRPFVISHGGAQTICPGPRNLSDAWIERIAERGGLIGVGFWEAAVCGLSARDVARTIAHLVRVAGPDHVALGSDFDGGVRTGFDAAGMAQVTQAMLDQGLDETTIRLVLGANTARFLRDTLP